MDIRELKKFDRVIIHDSNEWDNRVGIVDYASHGVVALITAQDPTHHYIVGIWNANNIEPFN